MASGEQVNIKDYKQGCKIILSYRGQPSALLTEEQLQQIAQVLPRTDSSSDSQMRVHKPLKLQEVIIPEHAEAPDLPVEQPSMAGHNVKSRSESGKTIRRRRPSGAASNEVAVGNVCPDDGGESLISCDHLLIAGATPPECDQAPDVVAKAIANDLRLQERSPNLNAKSSIEMDTLNEFNTERDQFSDNNCSPSKPTQGSDTSPENEQALKTKKELSKNSPTKNSPTKNSPTKNSMTKNSPTKNSPTKNSRTKQSPTKNSPTKPVSDKENLIEEKMIELAYATHRDGFSLMTLYTKLENYPADGPFLLVIDDKMGQTFGAYLSHPMKENARFYGNGDTFLFTWVNGFQHFPSTGANKYFMQGDKERFVLGCSDGGIFGLQFDNNLEYGNTNPCTTFANTILTFGPDFEIVNLEVWSFASQLLDEFGKRRSPRKNAQRRNMSGNSDDELESETFSSCLKTSNMYR